MAKIVQVPGTAENATDGQSAMTNVEAMSEFLASDALPVLLIAVVIGFLGSQIVRWYLMTRRRGQQE